MQTPAVREDAAGGDQPEEALPEAGEQITPAA